MDDIIGQLDVNMLDWEGEKSSIVFILYVLSRYNYPSITYLCGKELPKL